MLRPAALGPDRTRRVDELLGGELQARVGHAVDCTAARVTISKGAVTDLDAIRRDQFPFSTRASPYRVHAKPMFEQQRSYL